MVSESVPTYQQLLKEIQGGNNGQIESFGHYFVSKKRKLMYQVHANIKKKSTLFQGISIYVDGYTRPTASELRDLVTQNGGEYHHYFLYGKTDYIVASSLSQSKWNSMRKNEIVVTPNWIVDCVKNNRLLPYRKFLLRPEIQNKRKRPLFQISPTQMTLDEIMGGKKRPVSTVSGKLDRNNIRRRFGRTIYDPVKESTIGADWKPLKVRRLGKLPELDDSVKCVAVKHQQLFKEITLNKDVDIRSNVDELFAVFENLIVQAELLQVKTSFAFLERIFNKPDALPEPSNIVTELKCWINKKCKERHGAALFRI